LNGNYLFVQALSNATALTINPAPLTITANDLSKTYGETLIFAGTEFVATGLLFDQTIGSVALTSDGAPAAADVAGSLYVIVASDATGGTFSAANYLISYVDGSLSINPATLTYVADSMERLYGDGNPALTGTVMGLKNGETIATATTGTLTFVSAATATSNVGGYAIEGGGLTVTSANYVASILQDPSNAAALTINPATLTYVADAKSRFYGEANPALSGTMTGFKNDETIETATTGEMIFATPAGPTSGVNSYAIDGSGLTALNGNYLFVQALSNATALTINPAPLTITANDLSKTYGQLLTFTGAEFTSVGLQNGESVGGVMLASPGTAPAVDVAGSPYVIAVSGATGGTFSVANYLINYVDGVLMVTPAPVTVTANDASKFVNATLVFAGTEFSAVGLMLDHTIGSVTLTSAGAAASALVGTYSIVAADAIGGTFIPANYTFTFVDGVLTVTSGFDGQGAMMVLGDLGSGDGGSCGGNGFIGEPSCDALGSSDEDDDDPLPTVDPQKIAASGG
jgi:hypothetical protein